LDEAPEDKRQKMLALIPKFNIKVLVENDDASCLSNLYIENNIITIRYLINAKHISIATVNSLDMIISLNF
jgi:hypothetical protein